MFRFTDPKPLVTEWNEGSSDERLSLWMRACGRGVCLDGSRSEEERERGEGGATSWGRPAPPLTPREEHMAWLVEHMACLVEERVVVRVAEARVLGVLVESACS